ncbi:MAG: hypothetical protein GWP08_21000 [Nitrospiraceae bacterium]|nr:hypothetical protein [Nitrospiraceae bacterium]
MSRSHRDLVRSKSDGRLAAAIFFFSFILGGGPLALIMVLVTRKRSEYVRFHAAQCLATHIILGILAAVGVIIGVIIGVVALIVFSVQAGWDHMAMEFGLIPSMIYIPIQMCLENGLTIAPLVFGTVLAVPWIVAYLLYLAIIVGAMVKVARCEDVSIPIVGRLMMRWFFRQAPAAPLCPADSSA